MFFGLFLRGKRVVSLSIYGPLPTGGGPKKSTFIRPAQKKPRQNKFSRQFSREANPLHCKQLGTTAAKTSSREAVLPTTFFPIYIGTAIQPVLRRRFAFAAAIQSGLPLVALRCGLMSGSSCTAIATSR